MVARLQSFSSEGAYQWLFAGRKTAVYRQIGNAFPPPVARALGTQIRLAFECRDGAAAPAEPPASVLDLVYSVMRADAGYMTLAQIASQAGLPPADSLDQRMALLAREFDVETQRRRAVIAYRLGGLRPQAGPQERGRPRVSAGQGRQPRTDHGIAGQGGVLA